MIEDTGHRYPHNDYETPILMGNRLASVRNSSTNVKREITRLVERDG